MADQPQSEVRPPETDMLLKAQMAVVDVFLAYWKHLFGGVLVFLAIVFVVGQWQDHQKGVAREHYDALVVIDQTLEPAEPQAGPPAPEVLKKAAEQYEGVARGASGAVAAEAWLKAAAAWKEGGDAERQIAALAAASGLELEGALAYGARMAHAQAVLAAGRTDEGLAALRSHAGLFTGFYAEQALLTLVRAQADAGREEEAKQTLSEFKLRFGAQAQAAAVKALEARLGVAAAQAPEGAPGASVPAATPAAAPGTEAAPGSPPAPMSPPSAPAPTAPAPDAGTGTGG